LTAAVVAYVRPDLVAEASQSNMRSSGAGFDYPKTNQPTLIPLTAAAVSVIVTMRVAGSGVVARIPLRFLRWR
jgi:hypothetical protein